MASNPGREFLGWCGHASSVAGCLSCEDEGVASDDVRSSSDPVLAMVARQNQLASRIGPVVACKAHGRVGCDGPGCSSVQPMRDSSPGDGQPTHGSEDGTTTGVV